MRRGVFLALVLTGLALNVFLLAQSLSASPIAGCGAGSGCAEVLGSKWSRWFGLPVAGLGALIYAAMAAAAWPVALSRPRRLVLASGLAAVTGAALWFVLLQSAVLGRFCAWCLAAHGVGLLAAGAGVLWLGRRALPSAGLALGLAGVAVLAAGQVLSAGRPSHLLSSPDARPGTGGDAAGGGRRAVFAKGGKSFALGSVPLLGDAAAPKVLAEYLDYRCEACRRLGRHLQVLLERHPGGVAVVVLPVPLDRACNEFMGARQTSHDGACDIARLALAAWRAAPDAFPRVHEAFLAEAPADGATAREIAARFVSAADLDAALADPWIGETLRANIRDWQEFSRESDQLPKLLLGPSKILTGAPASAEEFVRVVEAEW